MPRTTAEKRAAFRSLHASGCFVLPNPWDIGSARMLQHLGFEALASTSSGYAWSTGRPDYAVTRDDVLQHLTVLSAAVDLPINADFESGFASEPEQLAANVALAIQTGIAGLSIEDRDLRKPNQLYDAALALERIRAARAAIDAAGGDVILVARTEGLLSDRSAVQPAIERLVAFAEAGADCLFAPGVTKPEDIAAMVRAVAPKPLNVLVLDSTQTLAQLRDLGVRRLSVGGALARSAWAGMLGAARQLEAGSFAALASATPGRELNEIFRSSAQRG
jgi:2-methylisocitrate lyase-like PEP mutase family enzyme